jgi:ethanolamine transporter EutH
MLKKLLPVSTGYKTGWDQELVWTLGKNITIALDGKGQYHRLIFQGLMVSILTVNISFLVAYILTPEEQIGLCTDAVSLPIIQMVLNMCPLYEEHCSVCKTKCLHTNRNKKFCP